MNVIKPKIKFLWMTTEPLKIIEKAARTCYKSESNISETSAKKLVKFLIKHGHESMLEHVVISYRVITNRGVTHEIVRHRIASYAQESTRYVNYNNVGVEVIQPDFELSGADIEFLESCEQHYNKRLKEGLRKEQARYFLPNGLKTEIVMTLNCRSWRNFFKLRTAKDAHPEIRIVANMILKDLKKKVPTLFEDL